jgi:dextranase
MDLIFDKVSYLPSEKITGIAPLAGTINVTQLGRPISSFECTTTFNLGTFPEGAYSIVWNNGSDPQLTSAFEVLKDPWTRFRYGFITEFADSVATENYVTYAKKLHLTAIQFYDWAWRHEFLTTDKLHYGDPLGQDISVAKIKELISSYNNIGATPCGYAAVYAVDAEGWERWRDAGLYDIERSPYVLGDNFLWIVDPADPRWLAHLISQLKNAHEFGFTAFHLDQYGWPKNALRADGSPVDLATRFPQMLNEIVKSLPECRHIFNNVNDYPTWSTSLTGQHATYIEVWDPHSTYAHLADLVKKARELDSAKPVILSAYLHPFGTISTDADESAAVAAFELAFASIVSGGASHLITGGDGRVLHHAYYVTNYQAPVSTLQTIQSYYDFVVAAGDLLFDPSRVDVTLTNAFGVNNEIKVSSEAPVSPQATARSLWVRIFSGDTGLTVHIINLLDQEDTLWDKSKAAIKTQTHATISIEAAGFSDQASIGCSTDGAEFAVETMKIQGNRLELCIDVRAAWTMVNIPFKKE